MVDKINTTRDEWILKFKYEWDHQLNKLMIERQSSLANITEQHSHKLVQIRLERDKKIKKITDEAESQMLDLQKTMAKLNEKVEAEHEDKLTAFLTKNLKQESIYDSLCSHILSLKHKIFSRDQMEEPGESGYVFCEGRSPPSAPLDDT